MQLEQKAAQILLSIKAIRKQYYNTTYHPHVVVYAFCIPLEVSLQFSFHSSLDTVNHLNRAGNVNIL